MHEQRPVQQDRQQEIGERPGSDDRDAPPHRLPVERARQVGRVDVVLTLVHHLDIASQGDRTDHPFGTVGTVHPAQQRPAEADRESKHLDAACTRNEVVPELVDDDQHAECCDECGDGGQHVGG